MTECVGDSMVRIVIGCDRFCEIFLVVVSCFVEGGVSAEGWVVLVDEEMFMVDVGGAVNGDGSMFLVITGGTFLKDNTLPLSES